METQHLPDPGWVQEASLNVLRPQLASLPEAERTGLLASVATAVDEIQHGARRRRAFDVLSTLDPSLEMQPEQNPNPLLGTDPQPIGRPARTIGELIERLDATDAQREAARSMVNAGLTKLRAITDRTRFRR